MEDFIEGLGITQNKLAVSIGVPPRRINEIVHGKRAVTADTAVRLARYFGTSEEFWMNLQSSYELRLKRRALEEQLRKITPLEVDDGRQQDPRVMEWTAVRDVPVPGDVARLLATVPEWFGLPESNAEYVMAAGTKETWTVRDANGQVVGVTLVDRHSPWVAEIHLTVVERSAHGTGVGTAMLAAIERDAISRGVRLLEVKTFGASDPDESYACTRHFYEKCGFLALEETGLWGEDTPRLIMVKALGESGPRRTERALARCWPCRNEVGRYLSLPGFTRGLPTACCASAATASAPTRCSARGLAFADVAGWRTSRRLFCPERGGI